MKLFKKAAAFFLTGILLLSFAACSPKVDTTTPEAAVSTAISKMESLQSMKSILTVDTEMATGGMSSATVGQAEINHIFSPASMKFVATNDLGANNESQMVTYAMEEDGKITTYMDYDGQWMKQTAPAEEVKTSWRMYDTSTNIITLLNAATDVKEISRKDKTLVLEGTLPADQLWKLTEETKAFQMVGLAGLPQEYFEGVTEVQATFTVDEATGYVTGYSIEYAPVLQVVMNNVNRFLNQAADGANDNGVEVKKYLLSIECSQFNKVDKITVPQEVLDTAIDFTNYGMDEEDTDLPTEEQESGDAAEESEAAEIDVDTQGEAEALKPAGEEAQTQQ